ncbi:MAG: FAD-binding oxidoreductase [Actinomycetia bacterium]|nr:FAD-binding oxidoreductase [Actinomycetes bacterium]MCP4227416.1 FAD-binding oxidoreductase [Actinomycetes bacterium]MCP5033833.1 FAD-binding oxidoreductase [Actinomycetes bacterium]
MVSLRPISEAPQRDHYDIVIIGGAIIGSSVAWFLSSNPDFSGTILVVERDPTYAAASTSHTNSCMRQQFSNPLNIEISQFAADYVRGFRQHLGDDPDVPEIFVNHFGYLYLAGSEASATVLRANQRVQAQCGAGTKIMTPDEIRANYPFYNLDGIVCGSHNLVDEGYFDSGTMFDWWRRKARQHGVEYTKGEVVALGRSGSRITSIALASGISVSGGIIVNASGPRAARTAAMAGLYLPVEPRKRFTFVFDAAEPLERDLPLTIDPTGVHVRSDGAMYMAGCPPDDDQAVDPDDFSTDPSIWEDKLWPALAHRIPAFERIKVINRWAGHYAYNPFDHNVIVGPHPDVTNFMFANGFSGHGVQQSPAIGRGIAELIIHGGYRSLDLTPLGYERIGRGDPFVETAII